MLAAGGLVRWIVSNQAVGNKLMRHGWFHSPFVRLINCKEFQGKERKQGVREKVWGEEKKWKSSRFRFFFILFSSFISSFLFFSLQRIILYNLSICSQLGVCVYVCVWIWMNVNEFERRWRQHQWKCLESLLIVFHFAKCRVNLTSFCNICEWNDVCLATASKDDIEIRRKLVGIMYFIETHIGKFFIFIFFFSFFFFVCTQQPKWHTNNKNNNVENGWINSNRHCGDVTTNAWLDVGMLFERWKPKTNKNCDISNVSAVFWCHTTRTRTRTTVRPRFLLLPLLLAFLAPTTDVDELTMDGGKKRRNSNLAITVVNSRSSNEAPKNPMHATSHVARRVTMARTKAKHPHAIEFEKRTCKT